MKRIQLTRNELEMINDMCAIASAAEWGEGDYKDGAFDEPRAVRVFNRLREKVWALIARADGLPNNLGSIQ